MISLLQPGTMLQNRYLIQHVLGQGGMAAVYLTLDYRLGQNPVAVKENFDTSPQAQAQFQREANVLARLSHPNLPKVFDHFIERTGRQYLVMEYIGGEDLETLVQQHGAFPEVQVLTWADALLDALTYLHGQSQPIVHRDIKPANIKVASDGKVKLVDFGLVKLYDPANPRTATLVHGMGSPQYASPEQFNPAGHTDARSDIYSLGATLYHLLTGQAPATATDRVVNPQAFYTPRHINAAIDPNVEAAILKAMELPVNQRFQTADEMRQALQGTNSARWRGWPWLAGVGAVGIAIAVLFAVIKPLSLASTFVPTPSPTNAPPPTVTPTPTASPTKPPLPTSTPLPAKSPTDTPSPTSTPTSTLTPSPTRQITVRPSFTPAGRIIIPPQPIGPTAGQGSCRNPLTFRWNGSLYPGQAYQVRIQYNLPDGAATVGLAQSGLLTDQFWTTDIPTQVTFKQKVYTVADQVNWRVLVMSEGKEVISSPLMMFYFSALVGKPCP